MTPTKITLAKDCLDCREKEDMEHTIYSCLYSQSIRRQVESWYGIPKPEFDDFFSFDKPKDLQDSKKEVYVVLIVITKYKTNWRKTFMEIQYEMQNNYFSRFQEQEL